MNVMLSLGKYCMNAIYPLSISVNQLEYFSAINYPKFDAIAFVVGGVFHIQWGEIKFEDN